jgi:hypothetical protein
MEIIPSRPYPTNSRAELRVFDKLREAFIHDDAYLAFHSLNLTRHESKRFGEADFVLVTKFGLFVLEVKGGGVRHENGIWYTVNRNQESYRIQDPFRQAETALHAIQDEIKHSCDFPYLKLPIGYGVIFPDIKWKHKGAEWDRHTVCDRNNFKNIERWLKHFFNYWQARPANTAELSSEDISRLKKFLRPDFELIEPLHAVLSKLEDSAVQLTEDQYKYLDIAAANKRVLCSGGAGTGKTFLAAELARRLGDNDTSIAFICKSNWLRQYLEPRIHSEYVTLSTVKSAEIDKQRAGIEKYDVLIVDEGQDLFNLADIAVIDSILSGGLKNGQWYIFHDINNQAGFFSGSGDRQSRDILASLHDYSPAYIPLTTNCRNTRNILNKIQNTLQLDMGNKGTGIGPEICEFKTTPENAAEILKNEISQLLKSGVPADSITVLSPLPYEKSLAANLSEQLKKQIIKLDDFSVRSFPVQGMSFAEIKNFKGLENEVIVVIDLPEPVNFQKQSDKAHHYVAMSRARGLLCVIWLS